MSNHNNKDDFDDYLTGNSELSELYRDIDISEHTGGLPGIEIDNSILAAAKREVNSKPRKTTSPFSANYLIPLSTAASILIVFALVSFFPDEQVIEFNPDIVTGSLEAEQEVIAELEEGKETRVINKKAPIFKMEKQDQQPALLAKRSKVKNESFGLTKLKKYQGDKIASNSVNKASTDSIGEAIKPLQQESPVASEITPSSTQPEKKSIVFSGLSGTSVNALESPVEKSMAQTFSDVASAPVNNELEYNEVEWQNLSSDEWLGRIKKIYQVSGEKPANIIIGHFNKKFPKLKLKLEDVIKDENKIQGN